MKKIFLALLFLVFHNDLFAASCCGSGASSSLIIIGDNIQEYSLGFSYRNDLGQTDNKGWASFHGADVVDSQSAFNFQLQRQANDRYQFAIKSAIIQKNIKKQNRKEVNQGMGDVDLQATFEFLPEFTYSVWKPRGFVYMKTTIPMSQSLYDSSSSIFSDVRGSGLYSLSMGTFFIKHISNITFKTTLEWQHFLAKDFAQMSLKSYDKLFVPLGMSYAFDPSPFAFGLGASWSYQAPKKFSGSISATSNEEYFWDFNTFINWTISREHSLGLSYSDTTLIGKNINSSLYRSLALSYTKGIPL
jgi:hypothetical protein